MKVPSATRRKPSAWTVFFIAFGLASVALIIWAVLHDQATAARCAAAGGHSYHASRGWLCLTPDGRIVE